MLKTSSAMRWSKQLLLVLIISSAVMVVIVIWNSFFVQERSTVPAHRSTYHLTLSKTSFEVTQQEGVLTEERIYTQHSINVTTVNNQKWNVSAVGGDCLPNKNIVFFKIHKCSSSTVQNLLFRFGEHHKLDFVLPPEFNLLGTTFFRREFMIEFPVKKYNVFCHHTRFSPAAVADVMPSDAPYTTIIRNPIKMFESTFTYMIQGGALKLGLSQAHALEEFLANPVFYYLKFPHLNARLKNPMLYDLGLRDVDQFKPAMIDRMVTNLAKQFDLVMMTEYFDESLILLRHLMCWELDNIAYFVLNARAESSVRTLSPTLEKQIRAWNSGDVKLYDVFNQTFWKRVEAFGTEKMQIEVEELRQRNEYFIRRCIDSVIANDKNVWHPPGIKINSFKLKVSALHDENCVRMTRTELPYTNLLRRAQLQRYNMIGL